MGAYSELPLTPATLATRLARSRFWSRPDLHPLVVKDALVAAKSLARMRVKRAVPDSMQSLVPPASHSTILDQLYTHPRVLQLVPQLAQELFVLEPRPPLSTALTLLSHTDSEATYYTVLRTELLRENFITSFAIVDRIKPLSRLDQLRPTIACAGIGSLSAWLWSAAPPVAAMLAVLWLGLGWPRGSRFPRVAWQRAGPLRVDQLRRTPQLRMANQIVQYYEDIRGVTVDNFHVHASRPHDPIVERQIHAALSRLGMEMRPARSTQLYADYWSEQGYDYGRLEWREPDQDPADLERAAAAAGSRPPQHSTSP